MKFSTWARIAALSLLVAFVAVDAASPAQAADSRNWDPGYIISDTEFYDYNSMTAAQIQSFLASKVTRCQPERSAGPHDPIVCLKDYRMTTRTIAADQYCPGTYQGAANELASTIIYKVAQACRINPKVLIVTLQKEQGLVTHTWPSSYRYDKAMGFACPDTAPCDSQYFGFQNQIYRAARQFQIYKARPNSYNYRAGVVNNIYFYPPNQRPQCGSSPVLIKNQATAGLYNYTPYQPNTPALNDLYGDAGKHECASFGNRNFWRDYTDWFGDPRTGVPTGVTIARLGGDDRYGTAVAVSQDTYPDGADVVFIATGQDFPDGLSAAPAAAALGGPLLLVKTGEIATTVKAELTRLRPDTIVVVGGSGVVNSKVFNELKSYAPTVTRIDGADRYIVSRELARHAFGSTGAAIAYVATGTNFPDALTASAAAGAVDAPVILVKGTDTKLPAEVAALLQELGVQEVRIAGGPAAVSTGIENALKAVPGVTKVVRHGGADRYEVGVAVNRYVFAQADSVYIASGVEFPDALTGAAAAAAKGSPLYVVRPTCAPGPVINDVVATGAGRLVVLGGTGAVSDRVAAFSRCS